jgi:deoxyribonuclease-4
MGLLGAHVSTSGGLRNAPENGKAIGCQAIQIFTKNQRQWHGKALTPQDVRQYREALEKSGIGPVMSHTSYLINLGHPDPAKRAVSQEAFLDEVARAEALGVQFVVFHPGSHLREITEDQCLQFIAESINLICARTPGYRAQLLLENTAGQGSNVGHRFEHLARILGLLNEPERAGVCFDTCHAFAAGYDLRTAEAWHQTFEEFERVIGCRHLKAFHVNDSKKGLNCRVDRHADVGAGEIGMAAFRCLVNDPRFALLPMVLETPCDVMTYEQSLRVLRGLMDSPSVEGTPGAGCDPV